MALNTLFSPSISTITGTNSQVFVIGSGTERASVTLSLPQDIDTISSPQFSNLTISSNLSVSNVNSNGSISVVNSLNGSNTIINTDGTISLVNTMSGIETYIYSNGSISTSNTSLKQLTQMYPNAYIRVQNSGAFSNSFVELYGNGYVTVANGNIMANSKVDLYSNGFLTVSNSSMMGNTKVDIASNGYVFIGNTTANTKIELYGNGQANIPTLYINSIQINPNSAVSNNVLIYNGLSFVAGNIPDATNISAKGVAVFNSNHFSVTSGNVSLSSNMYQTAQTVQSNTTSIVLSSGDAGKLILMNTASNVFVNVSNTTNFAAGQSVDILVLSNTMITFSNNGSAGVTINGTPGVNTRAQYSAATLICTSSNTYIVVGDLKV